MSEHEDETQAPNEDDPAAPSVEPQEPQTQPDEDDEDDEAAEPGAQPAEPQEPAEPQARGTTDEEWEARFKVTEQRFATYTRALGTILEEDATDLIPCPLCLGPVRGFVFRDAAGRIPEEQADVVKQFLGLARPIELQPLPGYETCRTCGGEGKGNTGSHVAAYSVAQCPDCQGRGYRGPAAPAGNGHVEPAETLTGPTVFGLEVEHGDRDRWDQPRLLPDGRDNPNYGRMPDFWIPVEPWGDTRGLTAQDAVTP